MRPMLAVSLGVSLLLASGGAWAGAKNDRTTRQTSHQTTRRVAESGKDKEAAPASFNKTFQWEEKELGPKQKGVDHDKIAAMQAQGRRDDAAKQKQPPKKPERTAGINGPASSVIPTQDIEKPHAVHQPLHKAAYTPPKQRDALDDVLADNGIGGASNDSALNSIVGHSAKRPTKHAKHARRRR